MEERQVNLEGTRYPMAVPFMVIATQNPLEYEGTYPLPEAQLDRFLFKVLVPYAEIKTEIEVLRRYHQGFDPHDLATTGLRALLTADFVIQARQAINTIIVEDGVLEYIARLTAASRQSPDLTLGASTRAAAHALLAAKSFAALQGRDYVTPDDVKTIVPPVFRHRILLKPEAEIEGLDADAVIQRLLGQVEVPR
jgi:MoxR-like ATPase